MRLCSTACAVRAALVQLVKTEAAAAEGRAQSNISSQREVVENKRRASTIPANCRRSFSFSFSPVEGRLRVEKTFLVLPSLPRCSPRQQHATLVRLSQRSAAPQEHLCPPAIQPRWVRLSTETHSLLPMDLLPRTGIFTLPSRKYKRVE